MHRLLLIIVFSFVLAACAQSGATKGEAELWERGAENNSSSPCADATCFGN
jgi:hypothetical protein